MIIANKNTRWIYLPLFERCKVDSCNIYQLICLHRSTRYCVVFKLRNFLNGIVPNRFKFRIEFPDCMPTGEYSYYLVSNNEWTMAEINTNFVVDTVRQADVIAIKANCQYIGSNGKLLVTRLCKEGDATGPIATHLTVLHTGLLRYKCEEVICDPHDMYEKPDADFIHYND